MENRTILNRNLAQMLKGGVIMDVTTPEQAKIAEAAGACAVMALERIPADIRAAGGVSRMSDPKMIKGTSPKPASPRGGRASEKLPARGARPPAPLTRRPRRRRRWGRICTLGGRLLRLPLALILLRVDVLGLRLLAPRHGASIGAPGEPRLFAHSATNSWSWEIYPPSAGTRMSQ